MTYITFPQCDILTYMFSICLFQLFINFPALIKKLKPKSLQTLPFYDKP